MDELIALIQKNLKIRTVLGPDTPLLSSGLIDSFHFIDFLFILETRYGVRIEPAEVGVDNFDTPKQVYNFLKK